MKPFISLCLALLIIPSLAIADQTIGFPKAKPVVDVTFPASWELSFKEGALYAHPRDDASCFIALDTMQATSADPQAAIDEAKQEINDLFKNATIKEPTSNDEGGLNILLVNAEGEDEDGHATIHFALIGKIGEKQIQIMKWIAPTKTFEKYAEAGANIINSIAIHRAAAKLQTYHFPDKQNASFSMSFPADWNVERSNDGAFIEAPDKQFTTTVIAIDVEHIMDATDSIGKSIHERYKSCIWNEGGKPRTHVEEDTGMTLTTNTGVGTAEDGTTHRVGLYQFAKKGSNKFYVISTWAPETAFAKHYEEIESMLSSVQHN